MPGVRSLLKGLVERSLVALGGPAVLRGVRSGDAVILAYHNVVPQGEPPGGDRSLHLPREDFARQLDLLLETHTVVELEALLGADEDGRRPPLAAVTFDDGYRGALTVGLEELAERGLPCTVFVSPALLGDDAVWWDALAPEGAGGLPPSLREEALSRAKGRSADVWRWAQRRGLSRRPQPRHAGIVAEGELAEAAGRDGVTLGSHGWSHANLPRLGEGELREELERPLGWLQERFPDRVAPWLSLPFGLWSQHVVSAAVEAGYRGVLDLSGGLVDRAGGAFPRRVPRKNVPAGVSPEGFVLRTAGL